MWKSITGRITLIAVLTAASLIILVPSLTDRVPAGSPLSSGRSHRAEARAG